jgi:hypothetical protein
VKKGLVAGLDLNLRPPGYEPDELLGQSMHTNVTAFCNKNCLHMLFPDLSSRVTISYVNN